MSIGNIPSAITLVGLRYTKISKLLLYNFHSAIHIQEHRFWEPLTGVGVPAPNCGKQNVMILTRKGFPHSPVK